MRVLAQTVPDGTTDGDLKWFRASTQCSRRHIVPAPAPNPPRKYACQFEIIIGTNLRAPILIRSIRQAAEQNRKRSYRMAQNYFVEQLFTGTDTVYAPVDVSLPWCAAEHWAKRLESESVCVRKQWIRNSLDFKVFIFDIFILFLVRFFMNEFSTKNEIDMEIHNWLSRIS